jgi:hypothetical protein
MRWPYLAIASGILICLGAGLLSLLLASRRQRLARGRGAKLFEGLDEIASQAAFAGGLLLMGVANLSALASVGVSPERHTALVATATILVLLLGVQLGRLLMRYQLRRLRGLLDTVTGEVLTKPANE